MSAKRFLVLSLGAILLNYALTWAFVGIGMVVDPAPKGQLVVPPEWPEWGEASWPEPDNHVRRIRWWMRVDAVRHNELVNPQGGIYRTYSGRAGWPFRALSWRGTERFPYTSDLNALMIREVHWGLRVPERSFSFSVLPFRPEFPGFLANACVYLLALLAMDGAVRRFRRILRRRCRLCSQCGYPADETLRRCPECGKPGDHAEQRPPAAGD